MSPSQSATATARTALATALRPVVDAQTYKHVLYLALSFPLGLLYTVLLTVGFALGVALSVVLVGVAVLVGTLFATRAVAAFEREQANALLDADLAAPDDLDEDRQGVVGAVRARLEAGSTWRGLGFLVLKFPLGIAAFVLLVSTVGVALDLLFLPVAPEGVLETTISGWQVADAFRTDSQRLLAVPLGAICAVVGLHLVDAFARVPMAAAAALLGPTDDRDA
jgi:hypothetical protein